jgi:hypothetical protein
VYDPNLNEIAFGTATDSVGTGYAQVVLTFAGVPGTTYEVVGKHWETALIRQNFNVPGLPRGFEFDDVFNFQSLEGETQPFPDSYDWFGPGPETPSGISKINLGYTKTSQIRYYTQGELSALITSAQSLLSSHCDAIFASVIGSSYNNVNFFESLRATSFIQYPPGAPNIPSHGSADAATLINQPGRPIELFPNFYPTAAGFPAGFQESILTHEGVHHYTGWLDFSDGSQTPDFVNMFYRSGYRNTSGTSGDFSVWISSGCPASQ